MFRICKNSKMPNVVGPWWTVDNLVWCSTLERVHVHDLKKSLVWQYRRKGDEWWKRRICDESCRLSGYLLIVGISVIWVNTSYCNFCINITWVKFCESICVGATMEMYIFFWLNCIWPVTGNFVYEVNIETILLYNRTALNSWWPLCDCSNRWQSINI